MEVFNFFVFFGTSVGRTSFPILIHLGHLFAHSKHFFLARTNTKNVEKPFEKLSNYLLPCAMFLVHHVNISRISILEAQKIFAQRKSSATVHFLFRKSKISHTLWDPNLCHIGISRWEPTDGKTAQLNSAQVSSRMKLTNLSDVFFSSCAWWCWGKLLKKCCKTSFEAFGFLTFSFSRFSCGLREMRMYVALSRPIFVGLEKSHNDTV